MQHSESDFIDKGPCADCGSSDACARYTDGHTHCFSCSKTRQGVDAPANQPAKRAAGLLTNISYMSLDKRHLNEDTCKKFNYGTTIYQGKPAQVAHYYDYDGQIVGQKIRLPGKDFRVVGEVMKSMPFGAHAFPRKGKRVVVTEGEIDAMTMSQVQGNQWPCVSIACGADKPENDFGEELPMNKIRKYIGQHRDYLLGFDEVVFMFDNDAQGTASAKVAAEVLGPTARIATLPLKDANEMLVNNRVKELIDAMWRAKEYRPDGIVSPNDVRDKVLQGIPKGVDWPWPQVTELTHGRRFGEVYTLGAGTGVGKTHLLLQLAAHTIRELQEPMGLILLEQPPAETVLRLLGIMDGRPYHLPHGWDADAVAAAFEKLEKECAPVRMYDQFGSSTWANISGHIRYLAVVEGCRHVVLDHLTALAAAEDDERKALERIMKDAAELALELNICLYVVSHLATPEGTPHEEGGRVMIRHFKGSRAIGFWSHYMIGLERNQQAEDRNERLTTTFRLLKARYDGSKTGQTVLLKFNEESNLLEELPDYAAPPPQTGDNPFATDTSPADNAGLSDF